MEFNALVVDKDEEKNITSSQVKKIDVSQLPEGDVLVNVEFSNINYKAVSYTHLTLPTTPYV